MITVKAFIERGSDGSFGVYIDLNEKRLNYTVIGDGKTAEEAKEDFLGCYEDMRNSFKNDNQPFKEVNFVFEYDVASFLNYYSNILSLAGLSRLIGVSAGQLSHYANGVKKPRPAMVKKIETALHNFSTELSQVHFNV